MTLGCDGSFDSITRLTSAAACIRRDLGEVVRRLADGGYRDVVEMTRRLPRFVPVIVWLRQADGGWTDLLEAGASGVLAEPYRSSEVRAVLDA